MKTKSAFALALSTVAAMALILVFTALASENIAQDSIPIVNEIPSGYRDWKLISMAHEEGNLHSFAAVLGNDIAIKAYREGKLPLPDGAIIVALHYRHVTFHRRRTTRSLDKPNLSFPVRPRTSNSW